MVFLFWNLLLVVRSSSAAYSTLINLIMRHSRTPLQFVVVVFFWSVLFLYPPQPQVYGGYNLCWFFWVSWYWCNDNMCWFDCTRLYGCSVLCLVSLDLSLLGSSLRLALCVSMCANVWQCECVCLSVCLLFVVHNVMMRMSDLPDWLTFCNSSKGWWWCWWCHWW